MAAANLDHSFGGSYDQDFQDQTTTSYPFSASPSTALSFDVGSVDPGSLENTPQQDSGTFTDRLSSTDFPCKDCSRVFSKQYELTLVSFQISEKIGRSLPFVVNIYASTQSL